MPKIWAEIQLSASLMKMNGKAHSWTTCLILHAQNHRQMATKKIGRDRDEHFDSLILLVPNLGMEGQPRPERKRPTFPKYLGTNFQVNQSESPIPSEPTSSSHCSMHSESTQIMACAGSKDGKRGLNTSLGTPRNAQLPKETTVHRSEDSQVRERYMLLMSWGGVF